MTINAGLRWEPFYGQQISYGAIANFNHDNFLNGVKSSVYRNAPAGFLYPGDQGFPPGQSGFNAQWWNVAPRLGLAWDVNGNGRMSVRSSYGLNYDMPVGETWFRLAAGPPYGNRTRLSDVGFDDPYATYPGGNPHPIAIAANTVYPSFGAFGAIDPDINRRARSRGTSPSSGNSARTGGCRPATWGAIQTVSGASSRRIPGCISTPARA